MRQFSIHNLTNETAEQYLHIWSPGALWGPQPLETNIWSTRRCSSNSSSMTAGWTAPAQTALHWLGPSTTNSRNVGLQPKSVQTTAFNIRPPLVVWPALPSMIGNYRNWLQSYKTGCKDNDLEDKHFAGRWQNGIFPRNVELRVKRLDITLLRCFGSRYPPHTAQVTGTRGLHAPNRCQQILFYITLWGNGIRVNAIKANRLLWEQGAGCCCIPMETTQWERSQIRSHHPAPNDIFACASWRKTPKFPNWANLFPFWTKDNSLFPHRVALKVHKSQLNA